MGNLLAYVGPGPGLTMAWAFLALLGTIALAILSVLAWPIRVLIRKIRGTQGPQEAQTTTSGATEATVPGQH